jgi:hypothetical protein
MLDRAPGIDDPERNRLCGGEETLVAAGRWMTKIGPVLVLAFIAWFIRTGKHTAGYSPLPMESRCSCSFQQASKG